MALFRDTNRLPVKIMLGMLRKSSIRPITNRKSTRPYALSNESKMNIVSSSRSVQ